MVYMGPASAPKTNARSRRDDTNAKDRHKGKGKGGHDAQAESIRSKQDLLMELTRQAEENSRVLERERAALAELQTATRNGNPGMPRTYNFLGAPRTVVDPTQVPGLSPTASAPTSRSPPRGIVIPNPTHTGPASPNPFDDADSQLSPGMGDTFGSPTIRRPGQIICIPEDSALNFSNNQPTTSTIQHAPASTYHTTSSDAYQASSALAQPQGRPTLHNHQPADYNRNMGPIQDSRTVQQAAYRAQLEEQIRQKQLTKEKALVAKRREELQLEARLASNPPPWDPASRATRRGGGGEPLVDVHGRAVADLRTAKSRIPAPPFAAPQPPPPQPPEDPLTATYRDLTVHISHPNGVPDHNHLQDPYRTSYNQPPTQHPTQQHPHAQASPPRPQNALSPGAGPPTNRKFMGAMSELRPGPSMEQRMRAEEQRQQLLLDLQEQVEQKKRRAAEQQARENKLLAKEQAAFHQQRPPLAPPPHPPAPEVQLYPQPLPAGPAAAVDTARHSLQHWAPLEEATTSRGMPEHTGYGAPAANGSSAGQAPAATGYAPTIQVGGMPEPVHPRRRSNKVIDAPWLDDIQAKGPPVQHGRRASQAGAQGSPPKRASETGSTYVPPPVPDLSPILPRESGHNHDTTLREHRHRTTDHTGSRSYGAHPLQPSHPGHPHPGPRTSLQDLLQQLQSEQSRLRGEIDRQAATVDRLQQDAATAQAARDQAWQELQQVKAFLSTRSRSPSPVQMTRGRNTAYVSQAEQLAARTPAPVDGMQGDTLDEFLAIRTRLLPATVNTIPEDMDGTWWDHNTDPGPFPAPEESYALGAEMSQPTMQHPTTGGGDQRRGYTSGGWGSPGRPLNARTRLLKGRMGMEDEDEEDRWFRREELPQRPYGSPAILRGDHLPSPKKVGRRGVVAKRGRATAVQGPGGRNEPREVVGRRRV